MYARTHPRTGSNGRRDVVTFRNHFSGLNPKNRGALIFRIRLPIRRPLFLLTSGFVRLSPSFLLTGRLFQMAALFRRGRLEKRP